MYSTQMHVVSKSANLCNTDENGESKAYWVAAVVGGELVQQVAYVVGQSPHCAVCACWLILRQQQLSWHLSSVCKFKQVVELFMCHAAGLDARAAVERLDHVFKAAGTRLLPSIAAASHTAVWGSAGGDEFWGEVAAITIC